VGDIAQRKEESPSHVQFAPLFSIRDHSGE
jgi:hypothetical protein